MKMGKKGDRNICKDHKVYNAINSHIIVYTCWCYSQTEASMSGHEILKTPIMYSLPFLCEFKT